jgi:8-hydroxy-5-deazaflavin:NADPH oxidoreductase
MKIAVIGTGHVGGALGTSWARAGHEVVFGSRTPDSTEVTQLLKAGGTISSASLLAADEKNGRIGYNPQIDSDDE